MEIISQSNNRKLINHWSLFCPQKLLDKLVCIFQSFRYLIILFPFMILVALIGVISNFHLLKEDLIQVGLKFNFFEHVTYMLFTINIMSAIAKGCIARYFNIATPSFGIMLAFGIIPEFDMRIHIDASTSRKAKLWLCSASLLIRCFLISLGLIFWLIMRSRNPNLSILSVALAWYATFTLLIVGNPFLGGDTYRILSIYFNMPNLRQKAFRSLRYFFSAPPAVIAKYADDNLALKIYALLSIFSIILIVAIIGHNLGFWLEKKYHGLGVVVFFIIIVYLIFFFRYLSKAIKKLQSGNHPSQHIPLVDKESLDFSDNPKRYIGSSVVVTLRKVPWLCGFVIAGLVTTVLFLPYQYEAGGAAVVSPISHQGIYPETKGIVKKVYFHGGEWLKKGTLIVEMENYRQNYDVESTKLEIAKKSQEIAILLTTPIDEEVELAKQQLIGSKLKLSYSKDDYLRAEALYRKEVVPLVDCLASKEKMELNQRESIEKEANLLVVQNAVNEHQIETVEIELMLLQKELQFYEEQLEKTKLRMPNDGKIITMDLKNLENSFLDEGEAFAEIEDCTHVQIEIMIPESDAGEIVIGNSIKFKAHLNPMNVINGTVTSIYPTTESTSDGTILKVVSVIPNKNDILKPGMTGYAKIEGSKMLVIQAFTKALIRFILVEVWSWFS